MTSVRPGVLPVLALAAAAACGDGSGPGQPLLDCDQVAPTALLPGQLALVDASETACLRLESPGPAGAEYLYVAYSAAGEESRDGTSAEYRLTGSAGAPPPAAAVRPRAGLAQAVPTPAQRFHDRMRTLGQDLARDRPGRASRGRTAPAVQAPPTGARGSSARSMCCAARSRRARSRRITCRSPSTARYVGTHAAIFLDNASPHPGRIHPGGHRRHRRPVRRPPPPHRRERLRHRDRRKRGRTGAGAADGPSDAARGVRLGVGRGRDSFSRSTCSRISSAPTTPRSSTA